MAKRPCSQKSQVQFPQFTSCLCYQLSPILSKSHHHHRMCIQHSMVGEQLHRTPQSKGTFHYPVPAILLPYWCQQMVPAADCVGLIAFPSGIVECDNVTQHAPDSGTSTWFLTLLLEERAFLQWPYWMELGRR